MKAKDIRELSLIELNKKLRDSQDELVGLRVRKQVGQVEDTSKIKVLRRDIARMHTMITEKQRAEIATA